MKKASIKIILDSETKVDQVLALSIGAIITKYPSTEDPTFQLVIQTTEDQTDTLLNTLQASVPKGIYSVDVDNPNTLDNAKSWLSENVHVVVAIVAGVGLLGIILKMAVS